MPATVTGNFTQTGQITAPIGAPIDDAFFRNIYQERLTKNKIYRKAYFCDIIGECDMFTWLEEFGGVEYDCNANGYSLLEYHSTRNQIKISADATIPAAPTTGTFKIVAADHYGGGAYILPRVGNSLVAPPNGAILTITAIALVGADTEFTVTVKQLGSTPIALKANDELYVLAGSELTDCQCPSGNFRLPMNPEEQDITFIHHGDAGKLCGDAIESCQVLTMPFLDANDQIIPESSPWWTGVQQELYRGIEKARSVKKLLDSRIGLVPKVKAKGFKFTPADYATGITIQDIRDFKAQLDKLGVKVREFAIFAGGKNYSKWQQFLDSVGGTHQVNVTEKPLGECSWINLNYCGIDVEGLRLHVYEECSFSNGLMLGSQNMNFPDSAIIVPMGDRSMNTRLSTNGVNRFSAASTNKLYSTVYFQSIQGKRYDMATDSVGILGPRNNNDAGCKDHVWSAETRFTQEFYCLEGWGYMGLGA